MEKFDLTNPADVRKKIEISQKNIKKAEDELHKMKIKQDELFELLKKLEHSSSREIGY